MESALTVFDVDFVAEIHLARDGLKDQTLLTSIGIWKFDLSIKTETRGEMKGKAKRKEKKRKKKEERRRGTSADVGW